MSPPPMGDDELGGGSGRRSRIFGAIEGLRARAQVTRAAVAAAAQGGATALAYAEGEFGDLLAFADRHRTIEQELPEAADELALMFDAIDQAAFRWAHPDEDAEHARALAALDAAVLSAGRLTIPHRLNRKLASQHVGGAVDFDREFSDELPDEAQRTEVLGWLARHGGAIDGVVDLASRRIYRTAPSGWGHWWRVGVVVWGPLLGAALLAGGFWLLDRAGADVGPSLALGKLLAVYACVLAGAALHVGLIPHGIRFDVPLAVEEPGRSLRWLELRWSRAARLVIPVVAVAAGLWVAGVDLSDTGEIVTAALAGYSADSLWSNGVNRFARKAAEAAREAGEAARAAGREAAEAARAAGEAAAAPAAD